MESLSPSASEIEDHRFSAVGDVKLSKLGRLSARLPVDFFTQGAGRCAAQILRKWADKAVLCVAQCSVNVGTEPEETVHRFDPL